MQFTIIIFVFMCKYSYSWKEETICENNQYNNRENRGFSVFSDEDKLLKSKREPRLFGFKTDEKDIYIKMEYLVPFINIPTKQTIDGLRSMGSNLMEGKVPKPHLNIRSLAFIIMLCLGFSQLGQAIFDINKKAYHAGVASHLFYNRKLDADNEETDEMINLWEIWEKLDKVLAKNNIDTIACIQRSICLRVKESRKKILLEPHDATTLDIIVEGISRTDWMLKFVSETAIADAINNGKSQYVDCDLKYSSCGSNMINLFKTFQNFKLFS